MLVNDMAVGGRNKWKLKRISRSGGRNASDSCKAVREAGGRSEEMLTPKGLVQAEPVQEGPIQKESILKEPILKGPLQKEQVR